jgi:hypothetical protein
VKNNFIPQALTICSIWTFIFKKISSQRVFEKITRKSLKFNIKTTFPISKKPLIVTPPPRGAPSIQEAQHPGELLPSGIWNLIEGF